MDSRRLEITCGEAPYLVSRYDASAGEYNEFQVTIHEDLIEKPLEWKKNDIC